MDCRMYNQCWMWNFGSLNVECPISPWMFMFKFQLSSSSNLSNFGLCLTDLIAEWISPWTLNGEYGLQNVQPVHEYWMLNMVCKSMNVYCGILDHWLLIAECISPWTLNDDYGLKNVQTVHEYWMLIIELVCRMPDNSRNAECGILDHWLLIIEWISPWTLNVEFGLKNVQSVHECWIWIAKCLIIPWKLCGICGILDHWMLNMVCRMISRWTLNVECLILGPPTVDCCLQNILLAHEHWILNMDCRMYNQFMNTECWMRNFGTHDNVEYGLQNVW